VEQRDEFDKIFCSIRDGLITYDTDLRIHFVNRACLPCLRLSYLHQSETMSRLVM
jgi:PAS domain-containing protein